MSFPIGLAACGAAARIRPTGMAVEPLGNAGFERGGFSLFPGPAATELGDAGVLFEQRLPILNGPRVVIRGEQGDDPRLVAPYQPVD